MRRGPLLSIVAAASIAAPATALAGVHSPLRVAAALLLFCLGPGVAILPLLGTRTATLELGLVVTLSLATCAVLAQSMLWLGAWSPVAATCALAGACLASIAGQLVVPRWGR